jgi:hypothetical protein
MPPQAGIYGTRTAPIAIVAFVLTIVGAVIFLLPYVGIPLLIAGLITGIVASGKIKKQLAFLAGRGLAIASIVIAAICIPIQISLWVFGALQVNEILQCNEHGDEMLARAAQVYGYSDSQTSKAREEIKENCSDPEKRKTVETAYDLYKGGYGSSPKVTSNDNDN